MKPATVFLTALLFVTACNRPDEAPGEDAPPAPAVRSRELAANFPLLPLIEKPLWRELLAAEEAQTTAAGAEKQAATRDVDRIARVLETRHPFKLGGGEMELGGLVYDIAGQRLRIPAKVEFPDATDTRHPHEVEVMLCTLAGRLHETLFVAEIRPLHLELLLHLGGHRKSPEPELFRIDVHTECGERIAMDSLVRTAGGEPLDRPLLWEFSGSDFEDLYPPDLSGDLAIFWHAHDSVLRIAHEGIATGLITLHPVPHPALPNGTRVTLQVIPAGDG